MKNVFYKVNCITYLHMGSGELNFNIVDNEVERDAVSGYPVMFSSGVKGALRDHFNNNVELPSDDITAIFGTDIKDAGGSGTVPGNVKFLNAELLFLAVRSSAGNSPYYMLTTKTLLHRFNTLYESVKKSENQNSSILNGLETLSEDSCFSYANVNTVGVDGINLEPTTIGNETGMKTFIERVFDDPSDRNRVLIVPDTVLKKISLPVLARNQLENGESKNLWYEEVVPHSSVFVLPVLSNGTADGDQYLETLQGALSDQGFVQFGGHATIGYGLTQLSELIF